MLIDIEHEKWNDKVFQRDFAEYLGDSFQNTIEPFKVIGETLRLLEVELEKVISKSNINVPAPDSGLTILQRTQLAYRGFRYSPKTKTLDALLNNLRCSISDLHDLRMQRTELIENQAKQQLLSRQAGNAAASTDSFSAVLDVQSAAERVYEAVASVADCRCHKYYFQLSSDLQAGKPPPFALSWSTEPLLCLFLSERGAHSTPPTALVNQTLQSELASDEKIREHEQSSTTECTCIAVRIESQTAQPQITSLCASVKAAATTGSQGLSICIGLLPHQTQQHSLYKEPLKPKVTRISLPDVFKLAQTGPSNAPILLMIRRYRLAFVLASSLLHFGSSSTSWFSKNWRSDDVFFLQEQSTSNNGDFIDFPHIAVNFPTCDALAVDNSLHRGTFLAQDRQLFALAIALIEIAHGTQLRGLKVPAPERWDHFQEFFTVQEVCKNLSGFVGARYANVVRRCFACNFGINEYEFSQRNLQEVFYKEVVCELRKCLLEFQGPVA
ncbi:hypothetical protein K440DRAFT_643387 [Wilcoxina mikolae CBS 423.85]|nr:hypothetical protein K440DRAFT_643387 [Wilcoxina mikolae CBS 423.85]